MVDAFTEAARGFDDLGLLGASRCHGWSRLDVVTHVVSGWQEMLGGMASTVSAGPTVDTASYWAAFADQYAESDPVDVLLAQRRRSDSYSRPRSALAQLIDLAEAVARGARSLGESPLSWQGHTFAPGDFLAVWAVEDAVHQLDLDPAGDAAPPPTDALSLARRTVEALTGESLPTAWTDIDAVLTGSGRAPVPQDGAHLAGRLPVLG